MPEIPFALQWTVSENELLLLKDSGHRFLTSQSIINIPQIHYSFDFFPNRYNTIPNKQTQIFLNLSLKNVERVEANFIFSIDSENYSVEFFYIYEKSGKLSCFDYTTDEFFDPEKKFFVDGKLTVKVNGIFKFENKNAAISFEQQKWIGGELGDKFWENDDTKDFTIITSDRKEIKVHKFILGLRSDVFMATLNANMKESVENKVEIPDYPFSILETAFKLIYNCNFTSTLSIDELMELLQFFDQYLLPEFKTKIELFLIDQISRSTVVRLTNCSIQTNSRKLKEKCMEFLMICIKQQTALADFDDLDKDTVFETVKNSFYLNVETIGTKACSSVV